MIVIAMLIDWLQNLAPVFQPMRSKAEPIAPCTCNFSCTLRRLQIIARNSDKFTILRVFQQSFENRSIITFFFIMILLTGRPFQYKLLSIWVL